MNNSFSYTEENDLFNFDYKQDLLDRATDRDRVFMLRQMQEQEDGDGGDFSDPFAGLGMGDTGMEVTGMDFKGVAKDSPVKKAPLRA